MQYYIDYINQLRKRIMKLLAVFFHGSRVIFQVIAVLIFVIGTIVSFLVPIIIKDNPFDYWYVQGTFMIYLVSSVFSYFTITNQVIYEANQRKYITNIVIQGITVIKGIIEIFVIMNGQGLVGILILLAISNFITSLIIYLISKKSYPNIEFKKKEKSFEILSDVKSLLVHKVGTIVAYNVDTLIITIMKGLTYASIYSQYLYITDNVANIVSKIGNSAIAGVGDLIATSKEKAYSLFKEYNALSFFIATIICVPLVIVINSFIQIWHEGRIETTVLLAIAFVLNLFYTIIRMPINTYMNSAGLFKETRMCPIIESIVNLSLSFILIQVIGLPGVLFATFIAYLVSDYFIKPIIIYKKLFSEPVKKYYQINIGYIIIILLLVIVWSIVFPEVPTDSYINWFLYATILFIVNLLVSLGIYVAFKQAYFLQRFIEIFKRRFRKEEC